MRAPGMSQTSTRGFDAVVASLPAALAAEGFGVLSEIDVGQTLTKKLGVPFRRYRIFGACNPAFAHDALSHALQIGVLLPCNVVVYERDDGATEVIAVDPMQSIGAFADGDGRVLTLARTVREKLVRVLASLS